MDELARLGFSPTLSKGKVGEFLLAHHLEHDIIDGGGGLDGVGQDGSLYEYKYSQDNQFNFNIGAWIPVHESDGRLDAKFGDVKGAYLGAGEENSPLIRILYLPMDELLPYLKDSCRDLSRRKAWHQVNGSMATWEGRIPSSERILWDEI